MTERKWVPIVWWVAAILGYLLLLVPTVFWVEAWLTAQVKALPEATTSQFPATQWFYAAVAALPVLVIFVLLGLICRFIPGAPRGVRWVGIVWAVVVILAISIAELAVSDKSVVGALATGGENAVILVPAGLGWWLGMWPKRRPKAARTSAGAEVALSE